MFGLKKKLASLIASIKRIENKSAFQAAVASAVWVAAADGSIDDDELDLLEKLIKGNEKLGNFASDIDAEMGKWVSAFTGGGKRSAMLQVNALLESIKDDKAAAEQVLVTVIDVADADNEIEESEAAVVRQVASKLGLNPANYGL